MTNSMFELLMQLPLFQGVSIDTLSRLVEKYRLHFLKYQDGETVVAAGDACTHVRFIVSGEVRVTTCCRRLNVKLSQTLAAPHVLGPDSLFGVDTTYPFTAQAVGSCGVMQMAKADYVTLLQTDKVFLFNILNYLSRGAQLLTSSVLGVGPSDVCERLVHWVEALTTRTSREVTIDYTQKDLCTLLGVQRKALLITLAEMEDEGLIQQSQHRMCITHLRRFIERARTHDA